MIYFFSSVSYFDEIKSSAKGRSGLLLLWLYFQNTSIIILDEPTDSLSKSEVVEFLDVLEKISQKKTLIIASHDLEVANKMEVRYKIINKNLVKEK